MVYERGAKAVIAIVSVLLGMFLSFLWLYTVVLLNQITLFSVEEVIENYYINRMPKIFEDNCLANKNPLIL